MSNPKNLIRINQLHTGELLSLLYSLGISGAQTGNSSSQGVVAFAVAIPSGVYSQLVTFPSSFASNPAVVPVVSIPTSGDDTFLASPTNISNTNFLAVYSARVPAAGYTLNVFASTPV